MTPTPDIAAIAKGLTKAQQEALVACDDRWLNSREIGAQGSTLASLCWLWPKGSDPIGPPVSLLSRDYEDRPLRYCYRPTEAGLAVRQFLMEEGR